MESKIPSRTESGESVEIAVGHRAESDVIARALNEKAREAELEAERAGPKTQPVHELDAAVLRSAAAEFEREYAEWREER